MAGKMILEFGGGMQFKKNGKIVTYSSGWLTT